MDHVERFGEELGRSAVAHTSATDALHDALHTSDLYSMERPRPGPADKSVQVVCDRCGQRLALTPPWSGEREVWSVGTYEQIRRGRRPVPAPPSPLGSPLGDALRQSGEIVQRTGRDGVRRDAYRKREPQPGHMVFVEVFEGRYRWVWFHRCAGHRTSKVRKIVRDRDKLTREVERRRAAGEDPIRIRV